MKPIPSRLNKWWLSTKEAPQHKRTHSKSSSISQQNKTRKSTCFSRGVLSDDERYIYNYNNYPNIDSFHAQWFFDKDDQNALLGKGGQGTVYKCYKKAFIYNISDAYVSGLTYCCKIYNLKDIKNTSHRAKIFDNIISEYNFVKNGELLHYEAIYIDRKDMMQVIIVMQKFAHSLYEIDKCLTFDLKERYNAYNEGIITFQDNESLARFAFDIACNIKKIHDLNHAHFDIKPDNVMFDEKTQKWCLIDYGLYRRIDKNDVFKRRGMWGTQQWIAPEISYKAKSGQSLLSKACDIYSFGLILLFVINGGKLYEHHKIWENKKRLFIQNDSHRFVHSKQGHNELCQYLKYLLVFGVIDVNAYELLRNALQFDRKKRANIDDILCMKYFEAFMNSERRKHEQI